MPDQEQDGELTRAGEVLGAAVRDGGVPGAVAAVGRGPVTLASWVAGQADTTPATARPMTSGTLFDLASLTKLAGTTTTVLALAGRGQLGLDDPAERYLPAFTALREGPVTIRHLLAHTSGLADTRKFYLWCLGREDLLRDLYATPLQAPPGTRVTYSDLGFLALGEIIATVAGEPLDVAVRNLVTGPLGIPGTEYAPLASPGSAPATGDAPTTSDAPATGSAPATGGAAAPDRFAATERRADGTPWNGVVHDENARLMGGVAGHAGLFSAVADLAAFCAWWVSGADVAVPVALRREAESGQTPGLGGNRGLGWVRAGDRSDILGGHWPASAVCHTGFTGTSLALDSRSGAWAVLLTNSVHFGRDATAVKALRRNFHAAVAAACFR